MIPLASAALSYAIVFGSGVLKLPQVIKILKNLSAEGISLPSLLLECLSYAIGTSWGISQGLDFKDYGEGVIISVQLVALVGMVGYFQRRLGTALGVFAPILGLGAALSMGVIPKSIHEALLSVSTIVALSSRLPQIYTNYKRKSTGQLAFLTFFLAFGGSAARVLTVYLNVPWEKGKMSLLLQYFISTSLNLMVMAQMYLYRATAKTTSAKKSR